MKHAAALGTQKQRQAALMSGFWSSVRDDHPKEGRSGRDHPL
jgi:hypothetical protein